MAKLKLIIGIFFLLVPALLISQNWQALGTGSIRAVRCMFADTINNKIYIGKDNTVQTVNGIGIWDGANWDTLPVHIGSPIFAINKFQNDIIISNNGIQKWDDINLTQLGNALYSSIGLYNSNDTVLYATGWFDTIGGVSASRVAKWNGSSWSAIDTTHWIGGSINCAIIFNSELYIGGNFWDNAGTISRIAKWNGTQWQSIGNGILGSCDIWCFEIYNNELYVGGDFKIANGNPGNCIAKWNGTQWSGVGGGMSGNNAVIRSLKVCNGYLYAAGGFDVAGGVSIKGIAKWDGTDWCGLGFNSMDGSGIFSLAVLNNELYIGGGFQTINGDTMNYVSKWVGGNYVDNCGNTTGIEQLNVNETLNIYPNPATNQIIIEFHVVTKEALIEIKNLLGETVYSELLKNAVGKQSKSVNLSVLSNGVYFVQVQDGNRIVSRKLVKQ